MRIICPECSTTYEIADETVGDQGRSVRCARCRGIWFVGGQDPAEPSHLDDGGADLVRLPRASQLGLAETGPSTSVAVAQENFAAPGSGGQSRESVSRARARPRSEDDFSPANFDLDLDHAGPPSKEPAASPAARPLRRARIQMQGRRWAGLTLAVVGLAGAMAALVTWRTALVRIAPQSASLFAAIGLPVNLRGLAFVNVATSSETQEEVKVLVIEGTIRNVSDRPVEVPRLRFAARDALGQEVYAWTALPARTSLGPNETMPFRTRLASPPAEGRDVLVRFFGPRDLLAQAQ